MKLGQIPENVYKRSVIKEIHNKNIYFKGGALSGEVCASFLVNNCQNNLTNILNDDLNSNLDNDLDNDLNSDLDNDSNNSSNNETSKNFKKLNGRNCLVISSAKNASLKELDGNLAIYSSINELEASGARTLGISINLLMPHRFSEEKLKYLVANLDKTVAELKTEIISFDAELLNYLTEPVLSVVAVGIKDNSNIIRAKKGQDLVLTKWVGMAGTVILGENKKDELLKHFSSDYIEGALKLKKYMSVQKEAELIKTINSEAAIAGKSGAITTLSLSKGGIYKTLWEMALWANTGLEVDLKSIPIKQETVEICNYFDLNPYELYSEGALLIACDNGYDMVRELEKHNISASFIGKLTDNNDKLILNDYERKFLTKPCPDELTKIEI